MPTASFLSILGVKKSYTIKDVPSLDPLAERDETNQEIFHTLNCFVSIANQDIDSFLVYGSGFASVLAESGTREKPAVDKLAKLFLLAEGGTLPADKDD